MKHIPILVFLGLTLSVFGEDWTPIEVDQDDEVEVTTNLEKSGFEVISWSNALVEVSDFEPLALRPLGRLDLTEDDPRWDPWLRSLGGVFHPDHSTALVWVTSPRESEARALVGAKSHGSGDPTGPRVVTGWTLVFFGLLYGILRLIATLSSGGGYPGRWVWVLGVLLVVSLGALLVSGKETHLSKPRVAASWLQHRWFQENWAYGARWEDWKPGEAWSYPSVEKRDGRLFPVRVELTKADAAWSQAAWESLDRRHPARLFGPENP